MLSKHEEQELRRQELENDRLVREQGSTFLAHTHNDTGGRFAAVSNPTVIGSSPSPAPNYPAAADWTRDPVGPEMPLGYSIEDHEPVGQPHELKESIADDASHLEPSTHSAKATSSAVPLAEPGDPTAVLPPAQSDRRIFRRA